MALPKRHWGNAAQSPGFVPDAACGRSGVREIITTSALAFDVSVSRNTDWYCSDCAKAARLALAKESAPKPQSRNKAGACVVLRHGRCTVCGSHAINPGQSGRDATSDLDLCDVCYWRKRAESAVWPKPRPISEAPTDGSCVLGHWSISGYPRLRGCRWAVVKMGSGLAWFNENEEPLSEPDYFLPMPPEVR